MSFGAPNQNAAPAQKVKDVGPQVVTPPVQICFVNLKEKSKPFKPGDEGSYGVNLLVRKDDMETLSWFNEFLCAYAGIPA